MQFANLCNFETALGKVQIANLQTNFKMGIRFRNWVALLCILENVLFLKHTPSTDAIPKPPKIRSRNLTLSTNSSSPRHEATKGHLIKQPCQLMRKYLTQFVFKVTLWYLRLGRGLRCKFLDFGKGTGPLYVAMHIEFQNSAAQFRYFQSAQCNFKIV